MAVHGLMGGGFAFDPDPFGAGVYGEESEEGGQQGEQADSVGHHASSLLWRRKGAKIISL